MSFQCLLWRLKATLVTWRSQSPTLQIAIVRSPRQHSLTPPMHVEPVTTSRPGGALPETDTVFGPDGSSLVTVMVADFAPKLDGASRMGIATAVPGAIWIGYAVTPGTTNSLADEAMPVTVSVHATAVDQGQRQVPEGVDADLAEVARVWDHQVEFRRRGRARDGDRPQSRRVVADDAERGRLRTEARRDGTGRARRWRRRRPSTSG